MISYNEISSSHLLALLSLILPNFLTEKFSDTLKGRKRGFESHRCHHVQSMAGSANYLSTVLALNSVNGYTKHPDLLNISCGPEFLWAFAMLKTSDIIASD